MSTFLNESTSKTNVRMKKEPEQSHVKTVKGLRLQPAHTSTAQSVTVSEMLRDNETSGAEAKGGILLPAVAMS